MEQPVASPDDRRYADTHEWHKSNGDLVVVGLSRFAVDELTDITFLDIQTREGPVAKGQPFGEIESVKATSDLYSGIDGEIVDVNQHAIDDPAIINEDPFGQGWLIKIRLSDPSQLDDLLSANDYDQKIGV